MSNEQMRETFEKWAPAQGYTKIPQADAQPAPQGVAQVKFKRSEFTKNWTTFNVRREDADQAEALLNGTALITERDTLRARVEGLPVWIDQSPHRLPTLCMSHADVLALIDKMGGAA